MLTVFGLFCPVFGALSFDARGKQIAMPIAGFAIKGENAMLQAEREYALKRSYVQVGIGFGGFEGEKVGSAEVFLDLSHPGSGPRISGLCWTLEAFSGAGII